MEKNLEKYLEDTFRVPGVSGVLCTDRNGLRLGSRGNIPKDASGNVAGVASLATQLNRGSTNTVVCLESDSGTILIKGEEDITTAVYKSPS